jgi:hypothetical protein
VKVGVRQPGKVEIVEGLQPGDVVVTAGQQRIQKDGTPVRVLDVAKAALAARPTGRQRRRHQGAGPARRAMAEVVPRPARRQPLRRVQRHAAARPQSPADKPAADQETRMQSMPEISIRRPVFATVLSLLVLLVGFGQLHPPVGARVPQDRRAGGDRQRQVPGASAEVIESQVTKPLEDSIAGIDAVDVITSISRAEQSQISVRFRLEKDADAAAAEVRDRTSRVRNRLPQAIDEPVIAKVEADAFPVIFLAFTSDTLTPLQINDLVNRIVKPRLQTVTGVADVRIFGERKYAMRVWLDPTSWPASA